jgi:putative ABC transport system ATP-binding protein
MKTFQRLAHEEGYCIIIVTHDPQIADESDVIIRMDSGRIVSADV